MHAFGPLRTFNDIHCSERFFAALPGSFPRKSAACLKTPRHVPHPRTEPHSRSRTVIQLAAYTQGTVSVHVHGSSTTSWFTPALLSRPARYCACAKLCVADRSGRPALTLAAYRGSERRGAIDNSPPAPNDIPFPDLASALPVYAPPGHCDYAVRGLPLSACCATLGCSRE
ncbi:hypothetical protein C8Q80DRAFT_726869 [Daedaleopsis nitida]|nr:hypothetical protein C8Q80DRAFT_726869 [Daedaleopsis nitida]